jgi:hypothetical protein
MWNPSSRLGNHGEHNGFNKAKFMATFSVNGKLKIRDYLIISAMKKESFLRPPFYLNYLFVKYFPHHDYRHIV